MEDPDYDFNGKPFTVYTDEHSKPNYKGQWNSYGVYDNTNNRKHSISGWEANSYAEATAKAIELNTTAEALTKSTRYIPNP